MILTGIPALEEWCKHVTSGYAGVNIVNMTQSWRSGLAFCAIIARFRPDLLDYARLEGGQVFRNCDLAFSVAEEHLGIPSLLDPKDMVERDQLDKLSIITYLAQFYHKFSDQAPMPAARVSLCKDDSIEKDGNATKDSGLDDSSVSSRESSPVLSSFSDLMENGKYYRSPDDDKSETPGPSLQMMSNKPTKFEKVHRQICLGENNLSYEMSSASSTTKQSMSNTVEEDYPSSMKKAYYRSFESLLDRKHKPFESLDAASETKKMEIKASAFTTALNKFNSLSTSNITKVKDTNPTKPNSSSIQTQCTASQTLYSSTLVHSQGTQTEDREDICVTCCNTVVRGGMDYHTHSGYNTEQSQSVNICRLNSNHVTYQYDRTPNKGLYQTYSTLV
jgi:hypothetical protein